MKNKVLEMVQDRGIQAGARRTYSVSLEEAWAYLVSGEGIATWLRVKNTELRPGTSFENNWIDGRVKVIKDLSHIRMEWKHLEWPSYSSLQVRVFRSDKGTTISFHQDGLHDEEDRKEMIGHWESILDLLAQRFWLSEN